MNDYKNEYADKAIQDYQELERLKLDSIKEVELEKLRVADNKIISRENRHKRRMQYLSYHADFFKVILGWTFAILAVIALFVAGHFAFGWGQPDAPQSPAELKHQREKECTGRGGFASSPTDNVWFPDYGHGEGLCLPKGQNPPPEAG